MPLRQELCPKTRTFRTTATGSVTLEDLRRHMLVVQKVGASAYPELIDARGAQVAFRARDVLRVVHFARELLGQGPLQPRAVVTDSVENLAIARTFASLAAGWVTVGVFDDCESAEEWLRHHSRREAT